MSGDDKLVLMANQIAAFFAAYPADQARAGVHDHIASFWTPGMRRRLTALVAARSPALSPLVLGALGSAPQGTSPADKEAAGPAAVGAIGASDAG